MALSPTDREILRKLIRSARDIAPWVSASLSDLKPGHDGEYERIANEFLEIVAYLEVIAKAKGQ